MTDLKRLVDPNDKISIRKQCELLDVRRSTYYSKPKGEKEENLVLMRLIDEYHMHHPTHGVLQTQDYLRDLGFHVNEKRVRRLLRKMGIMAIYPRKNLSKLRHSKYVHPYLLRGITIRRPNKVWAIDITYIAMAKGFMYLTAIIDLHSRYVVGWGLSNSLEASTCIDVLKEAICNYGVPEIVNSDQGAQFTCKQWVDCLKDHGIKISMDGKGRAIDNIFIERLWRTVKQDYVYREPADNGLELYNGLNKFFMFYNHEKHHQGIGRRIPFEIFNGKDAA